MCMHVHVLMGTWACEERVPLLSLTSQRAQSLRSTAEGLKSSELKMAQGSWAQTEPSSAGDSVSTASKLISGQNFRPKIFKAFASSDCKMSR